MLWHAFVEHHPDISTKNQNSLLEAQEAMYFLICNEYWFRHRSLSSWSISTEIIRYHDFGETQ